MGICNITVRVLHMLNTWLGSMSIHQCVVYLFHTHNKCPEASTKCHKCRCDIYDICLLHLIYVATYTTTTTSDTWVATYDFTSIVPLAPLVPLPSYH